MAQLAHQRMTGAPRTHFAPKAKQVLQIFCPSGASHIDRSEHKPLLDIPARPQLPRKNPPPPP